MEDDLLVLQQLEPVAAPSIFNVIRDCARRAKLCAKHGCWIMACTLTFLDKHLRELEVQPALSWVHVVQSLGLRDLRHECLLSQWRIIDECRVGVCYDSCSSSQCP